MHRFGLAAWLLLLSVAGISGGGSLWLAGRDSAADAAFAFTGITALVPLLISTARAIWRRSANVDVIALLAIVGALALGEYLAGAVIGLMLATGQALEQYAGGRAERELSALLKRAPRVAHRLRDGSIETIAAADVVRGDSLLIKDGDILPVDGVVTSEAAVLDESALTGESRLVTRERGDRVSSGTANAGAAFEVRATGTAEESTYAGILRMVRDAQRSKAPLVRLADRYARVFVPVTLATAGFAWAISGDPVRGLAVLVVATPCPLLLAAPIAIVSGLSRAARRGIVVKGGAALETMARGRTLFLDKTGTITLGAPRVRRFIPASPGIDEEETLRLAASLDQLSSHVLASSLVSSARDRGLHLSLPLGVLEQPGAGIGGEVDGHAVRLGNESWTASAPGDSPRRFQRRAVRHEGSVIFVSIDGCLAGAFLFDDPIRPDAPRVLRLLKRRGITETIMLTGDHAAVAESVGAAIGVDRVLAGVTPEEKLNAVAESCRERVTLMIGDGINDAPALATADVGIAMGARGATSTSETADVVLVVDRLDRLLEALDIARRSRRIAVQSMLGGMALSFVAMGFATFGLLTPVAGAVLQEAIDAAAILNALRALSGGPRRRGRALPQDMAESLRAEHRGLIPQVQSLADLADSLHELPPDALLRELREARSLVDAMVAHERKDESQMYPRLARGLDGDDPLAAMSRTHQEIFHLARTFDRLALSCDGDPPEAEDLVDLRRTLYALSAVLRLNIAQEEELFVMLDPETTGTQVSAA